MMQRFSTLKIGFIWKVTHFLWLTKVSEKKPQLIRQSIRLDPRKFWDYPTINCKQYLTTISFYQ